MMPKGVHGHRRPGNLKEGSVLTGWTMHHGVHLNLTWRFIILEK